MCVPGLASAASQTAAPGDFDVAVLTLLARANDGVYQHVEAWW